MKRKLHEHIQSLLQDKLQLLEASFKEKREALLSESKSTAGDKHETGRAMIQLEQEKLSFQLVQLRKQMEFLHRINPDSTPKKVQLGSLVTTKNGKFYLSTGIGPLSLEGENFFCIAPTSPIGQAMLGKVESDKFSFNGKEHLITKLE